MFIKRVMSAGIATLGFGAAILSPLTAEAATSPITSCQGGLGGTAYYKASTYAYYSANTSTTWLNTSVRVEFMSRGYPHQYNNTAAVRIFEYTGATWISKYGTTFSSVGNSGAVDGVGR